MVQVSKVGAADVFRLTYCNCGRERAPYVVDVRPSKHFKKRHLAHAFNVQLSQNGKVLADYSHSAYKIAWSKACWWDKDIVIYGAETLKDEHPVMAYLLAEGKARNIFILVGGYSAFEAKYSFLCTASLKAEPKNYPSEILPGFMFLGTWEHAENHALLKDLGVKAVLSIHNTPENLELPSSTKHLQLTLADVESENISQFFDDSFGFLDKQRRKKNPVLVHCGAGVSRSGSLVMAFLMRRHGLSVADALSFCQKRRSIVEPNPGFVKHLHAYEAVVSASGDKFAELDVDEPVITTAAGVSTGDFMDGKSHARLVEAYADEDASAPVVQGVLHTKAAVASTEGKPESAQRSSGQVATADSSHPKAPVIMVYKGDKVVDKVHVKAGKKCTLGLAPTCNLVVAHPSVSRQHARLEADADLNLTIEDLGSTHGTILNGARLSPHVKTALTHNSKLMFGASTRVYLVSYPSAGAASAAPNSLVSYAVGKDKDERGNRRDRDRDHDRERDRARRRSRSRSRSRDRGRRTSPRRRSRSPDRRRSPSRRSHSPPRRCDNDYRRRDDYRSRGSYR